MSTRLYVGNIPFDSEESELRKVFEEVGPVRSCDLVMDRVTNRPRGFAFVEMETAEAATAAIEKCHGQSFQGRDLTVNEARPRENRRDGAPGGGGGRFRGGEPESGGGGFQGGGGGFQGGGGGGGNRRGGGGARKSGKGSRRGLRRKREEGW